MDWKINGFVLFNRLMETRDFDVICIGAGGAGVAAAVSAARAGARVAVLSKEPIGYGDTRISKGVMAYAGLYPGDSPEEFYRDLIQGGEHLNDGDLARTVSQETALAVLTIEGFGHLFCRDEGGRITSEVLSPAGGHRFPRGLISPSEGVSMGNALRAAIARAGIAVFEETMAVKLYSEEGRIHGLLALHLLSGEAVFFRAASVVLATGGAGWLYYPHTDCLQSATGDGFSLAYEAGAELIDMEQVQFIPFGITHPRPFIGLLCGEPATAGPFGRLLNNKGEVILEGINTMTRAQVARAICMEVERGGGTRHQGLFLDLSPNLAHPKGLKAREKMKEIGIFEPVREAYGERAYDWEEPWDVSPTAHYHMGGIRADSDGRTGIKGLYAAGQAQGGIHGGNRLGSVSLAEVFIFGRRAGRSAAQSALGGVRGKINRVESLITADVQELKSLYGSRGSYRPIKLKRRLQELMWKKVGVLREEGKLKEALEGLVELERLSRDLSISPIKRLNREVQDALELRMMLNVAKAMALSALERKESRGAHVRLDFPQRDDFGWRRNILVWKEGMEMKVRAEEVRN